MSLDEPDQLHDPSGLLPNPENPNSSVADLLRFVAEFWSAPHQILLRFPAPGRLWGMPNDREFSARALAVGECLLLQVSPNGASAATGTEVSPSGLQPGWYGLVPEFRHFGSSVEPGLSVRWELHCVTGFPPTDFGSLAEARTALLTELLASTNELEALDLTHWAGDVRVALGDQDDALWQQDGVLPADLPQRSLALVALCSRILTIIEAAEEADSSVLSTSILLQRADALTRLKDLAMRALACAGAAPEDAITEHSDRFPQSAERSRSR